MTAPILCLTSNIIHLTSCRGYYCTEGTSPESLVEQKCPSGTWSLPRAESVNECTRSSNKVTAAPRSLARYAAYQCSTRPYMPAYPSYSAQAGARRARYGGRHRVCRRQALRQSEDVAAQ